MALPTGFISCSQDVSLLLPTVTMLSETSTLAIPGIWKRRSISGEPAALCALSKKNGPPGWIGWLTVNLQRAESSWDGSARMVIACAWCALSDIIGGSGFRAVPERAEVLEGVDSRAVTIVPGDGDGVGADAGDRAGGHVGANRLRIEHLLPAHFLDAKRAHASESEIPDIQVIPTAVLPEHGKRSRIPPAESHRRGAAAIRDGRIVEPAGGASCVVPGPDEGIEDRAHRGVQLRRKPFGDRPISLGRGGFWVADEDRAAFVPAGDDVCVERNLSQEWNAQVLAHLSSAAVAENIRSLAAMRTDEHAHVFDDAEDGHLHLLEHPQAAAGDGQADILWRGDDDRSRKRRALGERQLGVAGARGEIEDEIVQLSPGDATEEHLKILGDHRSAKDRGRVVSGEHAHRDHPQPIRLGGDGAPFRIDRRRLPSRNPKHHRDAWAKDVCIDQTGLRSGLLQRQREVHAHRRFADAAFA